MGITWHAGRAGSQVSRHRYQVGRTVTYRGHTLTRAWSGHVNVTREGGWCGGWPSFAAARRAIDAARPSRPADPTTA